MSHFFTISLTQTAAEPREDLRDPSRSFAPSRLFFLDVIAAALRG
jgi:hypothetical protein